MYLLRKKLGLVALLCYIVFAAHGQVRFEPISLRELLNKVMAHAPSLAADSMGMAIRRAEAQEVRNFRSPELSLSYQVDFGSNNNVASPYFGFGLVPGNSGGRRPDNNYDPVSGSVGIAAFQWEFYNFGGYAAQSSVAKALITAEQKQLVQRKFDLQSFAIYGYLQLLRVNDLIRIQQRSISRNEEIRRSIQSLARSGIRPGVDTSMAEAELSRARLTKLDLMNQQNHLRIGLATLSGLQPEAIIPDTLAEQMLFREVRVHPTFPDTIYLHPTVDYYTSLLDKSKLQEQLIRKQYLPKLFLSAAIWGRGSSIDGNEQYLSVYRGLGMQRGNYLAGVGVSYDLFDIRRKKLSLRTQQLVTEEAQRRLVEQAATVQSNILSAKADVETALQRLLEIPRQTKAASAAYRQKFSLYKNGLTDIVELNVAQSLLDRAERDYITAKYDYYLSLYHKVIAQNNVTPFLQLFN
ncbi:Outer membrane protein TolC [bacterium A37T11]|nr:Outer membrane protein TolC [bacterium A37T11]